MIALTTIQRKLEEAIKVHNLSDIELTIYSRYQCGESIGMIAADLKMEEQEVYKIVHSAIEKFPEGTARPLDY
ncbi:hypothetical protein [Candidatus Methanomassiliicoccus intestinalis]|uniref:hypothetical protein n=1 Tax=Candidatus Methanomassiliicoccus intestinalis TaxID=1406512 RepID=UPI0026CC5CE4